MLVASSALQYSQNPTSQHTGEIQYLFIKLFRTPWFGMTSSLEYLSAARDGPEISFDMNPSDELRRRVTNAESRRSESFSTKLPMSYKVYEGSGSEG
jgi:hypothetical protein